MTDARVPVLSPEEARAVAEAAGVPAAIASLSVFRVLLRHPALAKALYDLLAVLLWTPRLDARLRELVIMRIGWATGSVYEWTQHWRIARDAGVADADLLAVRDWRGHPGYGPAERAVLAATDETLATGTIGDAAWAACRAALAHPEPLLELVVAIGNWRLFSSMLRSLEVPLEAGVAPWPPEGRSP